MITGDNCISPINFIVLCIIDNYLFRNVDRPWIEIQIEIQNYEMTDYNICAMNIPDVV